MRINENSVEFKLLSFAIPIVKHANLFFCIAFMRFYLIQYLTYILYMWKQILLNVLDKRRLIIFI